MVIFGRAWEILLSLEHSWSLDSVLSMFRVSHQGRVREGVKIRGSGLGDTFSLRATEPKSLYRGIDSLVFL